MASRLTMASQLMGGAKTSDSGTGRSRTSTVVGTATSDSADGKVSVDLGGDVVSQDGKQSVEVQTTADVREGDSVVVSLVGADGTAKAATATGAIGGGDRTREEVSAVSDIATATSQHFWSDDSGAHVSTDAGDASGERNSVWNSLGMLFRKGANNILAILASGSDGTGEKGVKVYDGEGNDESNVIAKFTSSGVTIGNESGQHASLSDDTLDIGYGDVSTASFGSGSATIFSNGKSADVCVGNGHLTYTNTMGIGQSVSVVAPDEDHSLASIKAGGSSVMACNKARVDGTDNTFTGVHISAPAVRVNDGSSISGVFIGTKIIRGNGSTWQILWTPAEFKAAFGRVFNGAKDFCAVMNADQSAFNATFYSAIWNNGNGMVIAYSMTAGTSQLLRVNYLVILGA